MPAEIFAGISAFQSALNIAKSMKDMNDAAIRNAAVIDLQTQILAAQTQQSALLEKIRELEEKVRGFETWEAEKQRYELRDLGHGAFALMLKPSVRGSEPPHWVCANCYGDKKIKIIQFMDPPKGHQGRAAYFCPSCHNQVRAFTPPKWLD